MSIFMKIIFSAIVLQLALGILGVTGVLGAPNFLTLSPILLAAAFGIVAIWKEG